MTNVLHDQVVGIPTNGVMMLAVAIQAEEDEVDFGKVDGERSVGHDDGEEESHAFCLKNQIPYLFVPIVPKQRFTPTEKEDAHTHRIELFHFRADMVIRVHDKCDVVNGAVFAVQITLVRHNNGAEDRILLFEEDGL